MKKLMASVMAMGLAATFAGCMAESDSPGESTASSEVTVGVTNFVRSKTPLALRTCDNPGACDTGIRMNCHSTVFVSGFDSNTKMAELGASDRWALADGVDGEVYLSKVDGVCN